MLNSVASTTSSAIAGRTDSMIQQHETEQTAAADRTDNISRSRRNIQQKKQAEQTEGISLRLCGSPATY